MLALTAAAFNHTHGAPLAIHVFMRPFIGGSQ
jgi:hypothetical protein